MIIRDIDENMEICGERDLSPDERVFKFRPASNVIAYQLDCVKSFRFVEEVRVSWFPPEENTAYELSNRSRHYVSVRFKVPFVSERHSEESWERFRAIGVKHLLTMLGLRTWVCGRGIADRRGQDLFFVELDELDAPEWEVYLTIRVTATYADCLKTAAAIESFVSDVLIDILNGKAIE